MGHVALALYVSTALHLSPALTACRTGNVLVNGTIGDALVSSSGTGSVYLLGTNTSVVVDLAGVSSVYLRNANRKSTYLLLSESMMPCIRDRCIHKQMFPSLFMTPALRCAVLRCAVLCYMCGFVRCS